VTAFTELDLAPDRPSQPRSTGHSGSRAQDPGDADRRARLNHFKALTHTIESEIIPRLLLAHARANLIGDGRDDRQISAADVAYFSELVLSVGPDECIAHADMLRRQGVALERLFLDLFAPTARRLGEFWTEDTRSFTDVTIGLGTLQQVFRAFTHAFESEQPYLGERHALLFPAPGEQHIFGLFMVETFLHRAGWRVDSLPIFAFKDIRSFLRAHPVQLVGISASCDRFVDVMKDSVDLIREVSAYPGVMVMAGGRPFNDQPGLYRAIGADATAGDAREAAALAGRLVPALGTEHLHPHDN
jgi:methanogenic corrinoid protein MtbC1